MQKPLCVNLNGTLLLTNSLYENLLLLLKKNPFFLVYAIWILIAQGKCDFKSYIVSHTALLPDFLPYNPKVLEWLKQQKEVGREVYLITSEHEKTAKNIAEFLGIFDNVFIITDNKNFKNQSKTKLLDQQFGENEYEYINSNKARLLFPLQRLTFPAFLKSIRVHQYVKNILIFVPMFLAHQLDLLTLAQVALAFISFCLLASSVYLLNDLLDLHADRLHHTKSKRAIASGQMSIPMAIFLLLAFFIMAWVIASFLPWKFNIILAGYYFCTLAYSFYLKRVVLVDVSLLAILYSIRVFAGMVFVQNGYSEWLIQFSIFIFLSLAFLKRYTELSEKKQRGELQATGRGYHIDNLPIILSFGIASSYIATFVMALYLNSSQAINRYTHPECLWLICPLLIYWISRMWLLASERRMHCDPIEFALKDKVSYFIAILMMVTIMFASL